MSWVCNRHLNLISLIILFCFSLQVSGVAGTAENGITLYADSTLKNPAQDNFVRIREDDLSLEDLDHLSLVTKDGINILDYKQSDKVSVTLFLPLNMDPNDEKAYVEQIQARLNRQFKEVVYVVKKAYLPDHIAGDENGEASKDLSKWSEVTKNYARQIRENAHLPQKVDLVMGSVIGFGKTISSAAYYLRPGINLYSVGQVFFMGLMNQIYNRYPTEINKWKADHVIPLAMDNPAVQFYNTHPLLKTMITTDIMYLLMQGALTSLGFRSNPWSPTNPEGIRGGALSRSFLGPFFKHAWYRAPLTAAADVGVVNLLRKGYVNRRTAQYTFSAFGAAVVVSTLLISGGNKKWYDIAIRTELGARGLTWVASKLLPAKSHRLVILHPNLSEANRHQIAYVNDLDSVFLTRENTPQSTLSEIVRDHNLLNSDSQ